MLRLAILENNIYLLLFRNLDVIARGQDLEMGLLHKRVILSFKTILVFKGRNQYNTVWPTIFKGIRVDMNEFGWHEEQQICFLVIPFNLCWEWPF